MRKYTDGMKKIFAEVGIGNETLFSTEFEEGENEYRVPKFVLPKKVESLYLRIWIWKTVYIFSTNNFFEIKKKSRNTFKLIFGISGY